MVTFWVLVTVFGVLVTFCRCNYLSVGYFLGGLDLAGKTLGLLLSTPAACTIKLFTAVIYRFL
jgi:hypothetical protein